MELDGSDDLEREIAHVRESTELPGTPIIRARLEKASREDKSFAPGLPRGSALPGPRPMYWYAPTPYSHVIPYVLPPMMIPPNQSEKLLEAEATIQRLAFDELRTVPPPRVFDELVGYRPVLRAERPRVCIICSLRFIDEYTLRMHLAVNHAKPLNEKPQVKPLPAKRRRRSPRHAHKAVPAIVVQKRNMY